MTKPTSGPDSVTPVSAGRDLAARAFQSPAVEPNGERPYDEYQTMRAWEMFVSSGRLDPSQTVVRAAIRQSWERSATLGVDAQGRGSPEAASGDRLHALRQENEDLLLSARGAFHEITSILSEAGTMAVITDRSGIILDVSGSERTIESAHDIRLEVGAAWNEAVAGTNGIGTALVTGTSVHVHAAEHFCRGVKAWACVGAPIRDPVDGRIIGLIDFSGPQEFFHSHSVALALLSARQIEQALAERLARDRVQVLGASLDRLHGFAHGDGVVVLDRFGRVLHFNEPARRAWSALDLATDLTLTERIACLNGHATVEQLASCLPRALHAHGIEPLVVDGAVRGAMLVFKSRAPPTLAAPTVTSPADQMIDAAKAAIVGECAALTQAIERTVRAARGKTAILLEGETGVGKELFAQLAHAVGKVTGKEPFVALNCGAVSKELLGGELFGHAPGAFTGATREGRAGRFEHAHGGTLSLDEIGEMPLDLQPYLLRALEERVVYRLGENKPRPIDVRLIASTNRNLKQEVEEGRFRRDLYYRIGVVRITIPPLRDRAGDIPRLIAQFNTRFATQYGCEPLRFQAAVLAFLEIYAWPGNVRELRNLVEGLVLMTKGDPVGLDDLPQEMLETSRPSQRSLASLPPPVPPGRRCLQETERRAIEQAIADAGGNVSLAADRLGVARSTIYRKFKHYKDRGAS